MKKWFRENIKYIVIPAVIAFCLCCLAGGLLLGGFAHFLLGG